jgi:hypothetical protein
VSAARRANRCAQGLAGVASEAEQRERAQRANKCAQGLAGVASEAEQRERAQRANKCAQGLAGSPSAARRNVNAAKRDVSELFDAWQAALGAEQQAAFGYALLGPNLPENDQQLARTSQAAHERTRDATAQAIDAAGQLPRAPQGDYPALYPAANKPGQLAVTLEDECAAAWRYAYLMAAEGKNTIGVRKQAQQALSASAVRATQWRVRLHSTHPTVAFPGVS